MLAAPDVEAWRVRLDGPPRSFSLDGELYEVVAPWSSLLGVLPLVEWHMPFVTDMVHPGDVDRLLDRFDDDDDDLTLDDVRPALEALVEAATGRRWWVAQRLYATLAHDWADLDGALTLAGVDLARLLSEPARVCNLMYAQLTAGADAPKLAAFEAKLSRPPAGVDTRARPVLTPEQEGAAFLAAMATTTGGRLRASVARPPAEAGPPLAGTGARPA